jgi:4-hydroxy-3-methylbut-2-enyl diphosphate reductase IspH
MDVDRVLLAAPRGFCAGVEMAIKALGWMVRVFEPPVYCYHEIVHNRLVVDRFKRLGVVFVDDVSEVPPGAPLMLSAHGSAPEVVAEARAGGGFVVDAVCPLVTKVHHEVKVRAGKGYSDELPDDLSGLVGVTAGASAPEELVRQVIARLDPAQGIEEVAVTSEDEYFPPPRELRELLAALDAAVSVTLGAPPASRSAFADDRHRAASDVLDALASA